jgi:hypothetical protein
MSFCSWIKNIIYCRCCKPKSILDLKNEFNAMDDTDVTVSFNPEPQHNNNDAKGYSLSDEITYNEIYNR